ncbi:MAG: hypothetical protein O2800_01625, partial [Planctomycetota bacterium]|nr:hypothetical protein [Planctomycetota bacterium]
MKCVSLLALALVCSSTFAQDVSDAPKADPPIRDSVPLGSDPEVTLRKAKPESLKARTRRARQEFNDSVAQLDAGAAQASLDILTELVPLDAETAAAASYNKGCSQMAVIPPTPPSDGSKPPQEDPAQRALARQAIEQAHRAFRDAAIADSSNRDARINAERTHKLLKQMDEEDEEEKKEQQEKEEQEKDGEPKDGEPKDGEPKDGEPKDGEPKDGEPKDGEPKDGEPKDGEPKDGEPKDSE